MARRATILGRAPAGGRRPRLLGGLMCSRRGGVMVEMAFALPVMLTLLMGTFEVARYVLIMQKLDRTAMSVGDLVSRGAQVTTQDLTNIFDSVRHLMDPFAFTDRGVVLISAVTRSAGDPPEVVWQETGAGSLVQASKVGLPGGAAVLPQNLQPRENESVYVAEVFYDYQPMMFTGIVGPAQVYNWAVFRARLSDQTISIN